MQVGLIVLLALASPLGCNLLGRRGRGRGRGGGVQRGGRQLAGYEGGGQPPPEYGDTGECGAGAGAGAGAGDQGVDFGGCQEDPDTGFCCVEKLECVPSLEK